MFLGRSWGLYSWLHQELVLAILSCLVTCIFLAWSLAIFILMLILAGIDMPTKYIPSTFHSLIVDNPGFFPRVKYFLLKFVLIGVIFYVTILACYGGYATLISGLLFWRLFSYSCFPQVKCDINVLT